MNILTPAQEAINSGGGAAAGSVIGAIAGGGAGALVGGLVGGGAGAGAQTLTRGKSVHVPAENRNPPDSVNLSAYSRKVSWQPAPARHS
jgi:hypothetical protein